MLAILRSLEKELHVLDTKLTFAQGLNDPNRMPKAHDAPIYR